MSVSENVRETVSEASRVRSDHKKPASARLWI